MFNKNLFLLAIIFTAFSCQDQTDIGEVLLQNEVIELSYKNNFEIKAATFKGSDPVAFTIYVDELGTASITSPSTALIGSINDPIFGKVASSFYTRIVYNPNASVPSFTNLTLDSAVITLAYDTLGNYGNANALHNIKIEEITEDFKDLDTIYSSKKLTVNGNAIASKTLIAAPKDSISILSHIDTSALKLPPQIRIRIDQSWAEQFIRNPLIETGPSEDVNDILYSVLKGIKISSETNDNGILGLAVNDGSIASTGLVKMIFYFTDATSTKSNYQFYFTRQKFNSFEFDHSGSVVESFLNDETKGDSLIFIQSMGGLNSYIDLKDLITLDNKVINFAELEFTVANLPGDNLSLYPPINQLIALKTVDGTKVEIDDLAILRSLNLPIITSFGGDLVDENNLEKYKLNITRHVKSLQRDPNLDTKIYIEPNVKIDRVSRSVIYGPKHSAYPIKLKVTYTEN